MDPMLLVGLAVVAVGAGIGAFLMFGQRTHSLADSRPALTEPSTERAAAAAPAGSTILPDSRFASQRLTAPSGRRELPEHLRPPVPPGLRSSAVNIPWHRRLRSGVGLAVLVIGFGMAVGAILGLGVVALNAFIG